jgi:PAS domain S-box-containing protein
MTSLPDSTFTRSVTKEDLEAILDSLVDGVVMLDDEGKIMGINRAACEILEVEKDEAVEADCCELMEKQLCESAAAVRNSIRNRRPVSGVQVAVQTRSGRKRVLVFQTNLLRSAKDRHRGSVLVLRDVTELAAIKEALAQRYWLHNDERHPGGPHTVASTKDSTSRPQQQRRAVEAEVVREMLEAAGWNVAKAARRLQVSRTTLYKRIAELGIRRPDG